MLLQTEIKNSENKSNYGMKMFLYKIEFYIDLLTETIFRFVLIF